MMSHPQESAQKKHKKGEPEPRKATHKGKTTFESTIMLDLRTQFCEKGQSAVPEVLLFGASLLEAEDNRLLCVYSGVWGWAEDCDFNRPQRVTGEKRYEAGRR
jgi:hypothetical protein